MIHPALAYLGMSLSLWAVVSCGLPHDAEGTLDRVSGGTLRVGVADNPPWVSLSSGEPTGVEVELVESFAEAIDADIEWIDGQVEELAAAVHVREIDLLIGGLTGTSKVSSMASLSHPYLTTQVVVAVPAGEEVQDIAGMEVAAEASTEAAGILRKTDAIPVLVEDVAVASGPVAIESYLVDDLGLNDTGVTLIESDHVMGVPHGENAFLLRLERFLLEQPAVIDRVLEEHDGL